MSAAVAGGAAGAAAARRRRMMQMIGANGLNTNSVEILAHAEKLCRHWYNYEIGPGSEYVLLVKTQKTVQVPKLFGKGTKDVIEKNTIRVSFGDIINYLPDRAVIIGIVDDWMSQPSTLCIMFAILPDESAPVQ